MAADNHHPKRSDQKANERILRERRAKNFEEQIKTAAQSIERRKQLFEGINKFVSQQGGWVVSPPGIKEIRIEIPKNSSLPAKLRDLNYTPRHVSTGTRIQSGTFLPVDVVEILLPGLLRF